MIEYKLIRSKRKSISLSVTGEQEVVVRAPLRMPVKDVESFIVKHSAWVEKHKADIKERAEKGERITFTDSLNEELKRKASEFLPQRTIYFGGIMGVAPVGVKITSAKMRWGSCSGKDSICFSYRIMLLPLDLIDYIIIHELAHIRVKNHSAAFYREVAKYMPDHQEKRKRLREINVCNDYMELI